MSIIKHNTLQKIVAHYFRYDPRILKEKGRGKFTKEVLFLHDNAPAHRALAIQKQLAYLIFQCVDHPPYSPDLAPSDYHLFPGLKKKII